MSPRSLLRTKLRLQNRSSNANVGTGPELRWHEEGRTAESAAEGTAAVQGGTAAAEVGWIDAVVGQGDVVVVRMKVVG